MDAEDGGPLVVFAEEQALSLEVGQFNIDGLQLGHNIEPRGRVRLLFGQVKEHPGVVERVCQSLYLADHRFEAGETPCHGQGPLLIIPQVLSGRSLRQLG